MIQAARIIATALATTGLTGAGIGLVFGSFILGVTGNPFLEGQLLSYAILGFAIAIITRLFALMIVLLLYVAIRLFLLVILVYPYFKLIFNSPPKPYGFTTVSKLCVPTILGLFLWPIRPRAIYAGSVIPHPFLGKTIFGHQITSVVVEPHNANTLEMCKLQLEHSSGTIINNLPLSSEIIELVSHFL